MKPRKTKSTVSKLVRTQQATVAQLINSATHHLGETTLPYVILIGDSILSNCPKDHARAIVLNQARLLDKVQEVEIDRQAERIVDGTG